MSNVVSDKLKKMLKYLFGDYGNRLIYRIVYIKNKRKFVRMSKKYNQNKINIINRISKKDKIDIIFFVNNMGMWKYNGLVQLLLNDNRYNILLIPFTDLSKDIERNKKDHDDIIGYCINNKIPYLSGCDFILNKYRDLSFLDPDVVVYTQPYNIGNKKWGIDKYVSNSLFLYTPYGLSVTGVKELYDTYLLNIAWKIFAANKLEKRILINNRSLKYDNVCITGASIYDDIKKAKVDNSPWKCTNKTKIIWAPHHSIDSTNSFSTSNFERISDEMIRLAKKYSEVVEICFKPHPALYDRLIEKYGISWTNNYYEIWNNMPNTFVCLGSYVELFAFSDGMIHDCCSFIGEYLYTNKPVMYIAKKGVVPAGVDNEFGVLCYNQHYCGYEINDIDNFIIQVINKEDPLKESRDIFVKHYILPPNNNSVADNMKREIDSLFN